MLPRLSASSKGMILQAVLAGAIFTLWKVSAGTPARADLMQQLKLRNPHA